MVNEIRDEAALVFRDYEPGHIPVTAHNVKLSETRALFQTIETALINGGLAVTGDITDEANLVFRDYETDGVPSSGVHRPVKSEVRALFETIDSFIGSFNPDREFQAETEALVARFDTPPTAGRKIAIDNLILALKTATIWDKLDVMWVTAAANEQAACLNWKGDDTFNLIIPTSEPTFTADRGFAGDGTSSYIDTGWEPDTDPVNYTLNSASVWVVSTEDIAEDKWDIGDFGGAPHTRLAVRRAANTFMVSVNDGSGTDFTDSFHGVGLFGGQRRGASDKRYWINGIMRWPHSTTAATALSPSSQWLCGANSTVFSARQIGFAAYGAALTGLEEELYEAVRAYFNLLGVTLDVDYGAYPAISGGAVTITDDGRHNAFPGLARLPNGSLVAIYRSGTSHTAGGRLDQKISTDEGQTWGSATTIVSTQDARDPEVVLLSGSPSTLLLSYCVTAPAGTINTYVKHGIVSGNDITWGDPITVSHGFTGTICATSSKAIELASGRIILPIWGETGTNTVKRSAAIAMSENGGLTWTDFVVVAEGSDATGAYYSEMNGVQFSDGEIFMMIRDGYGAGGYVSSRSTDDGATWSALDTEIRNISNHQTPGRPALALYGNDRIFFMGRHYPYDNTNTDIFTMFSASKDRGEGFTYAQEWGDRQYTYASHVVYSATRIGSIISQEDSNQIAADLYYQEFTVS